MDPQEGIYFHILLTFGIEILSFLIKVECMYCEYKYKLERKQLDFQKKYRIC